jgi:RNA polymerase sigma-70 factor, ECF subfamily
VRIGKGVLITGAANGIGAPPRMVNLVADRQLIGDALAQLSAEHRAVILHSYYEARTTAQIADDLQIAEAAVNSRLHYAMRALRRSVQEMGGDR